MCRIMIGDSAAAKLGAVPLSNDTVARRIEDMSNDTVARRIEDMSNDTVARRIEDMSNDIREQLIEFVKKESLLRTAAGRIH